MPKHWGWCLLFWIPLCLSQEIVISAASSLNPVLLHLVERYQINYPDQKITLNFGASGTLLKQIEQGAPIDGVIFADENTMQVAKNKQLVFGQDVRPIVANQLVLIVPAASTQVLTQLSGLRQPSIKTIAIGQANIVPAGRYAEKAIHREKLMPVLRPKLVFAQSAKQIVNYVAQGEVDAGLVYRTDAEVAKRRVNLITGISGLDIRYWGAPVSSRPHSSEVKHFLIWLQGKSAQRRFAQAGFLPLDITQP